MGASKISRTASSFTSSPRQVLAYYREEMLALSGVPKEDRQQWAWMSANLKLALEANTTNSGDTRYLGLNACAIDGRYYYYIPHNNLSEGTELLLPSGTKVPIPDYRTVSKDRPVYRIPRPGVTDPFAPQRELKTDWMTTPQDWLFNKNDIAAPVPIPGVSFPPGVEELDQ